MTIQKEKAKELFNEIRDSKTRRPDLPEFFVLKANWSKCEVTFSIGWFDEFIVTFRPKTIGVKFYKTDKITKERKEISKSYPLEQENLLDTILSLYKP